MPDSPRPGSRSRRGRWRSIAVVGLSALLAWQSFKLRWSRKDAVVSGPDRVQTERPHTAFEPTDWNVGPVALIYVGTLLLLIVTCLVVIAAYPTSLPDVGRKLRIAPPGPGLQTDPERDLHRLRAKEEKELNTYYWMDKQKGVVHIPIAQAMKKLAATGIPGFPKAQQ